MGAGSVPVGLRGPVQGPVGEEDDEGYTFAWGLFAWVGCGFGGRDYGKRTAVFLYDRSGLKCLSVTFLLLRCLVFVPFSCAYALVCFVDVF